MNKSEAAKVLTYVMAQHAVTISDDLVTVWADQFDKFPYKLCMKAARVVVSRKSYGPPKASDLHEAIQAMQTSRCSDEEAWGHLLGCAQRIGRYDQPRAMRYLEDIDPAIAQAAEPLYMELCNSESSQLSAIRAHFWRTLGASRVRVYGKQAGLTWDEREEQMELEAKERTRELGYEEDEDEGDS